jgi:hypothetical protein
VGERSRVTPEATDQTANNSDDSPADGIQGDHADQHECEHDQGAPPSRSPWARASTNPAMQTRTATVKKTRPGWESRSRCPSHLQ